MLQVDLSFGWSEPLSKGSTCTELDLRALLVFELTNVIKELTNFEVSVQVEPGGHTAFLYGTGVLNSTNRAVPRVIRRSIHGGVKSRSILVLALCVGSSLEWG